MPPPTLIRCVMCVPPFVLIRSHENDDATAYVKKVRYVCASVCLCSLPDKAGCLTSPFL